MSPVSKVVFADRRQALDFAAACGGKMVDYKQALLEAAASLAKENRMINTRRLQKGVIAEPSAADRCVVCEMFPARYPYGKCQIKTRQGDTLHFCSTQCLFAFLGRPSLYVQPERSTHVIWVVDRTTGMWISARAAFYVIGSAKVFGPMGYEALAFGRVEDARAFADRNGGRVAGFVDVTIEKVVPRWKY
jgi:nitrous oxide reductase accessory protein NosL